jgi:hypothetical protein
VPTVTVNVAHTLGADEAAARLKSLARRLQERYGRELDDVDAVWYGHVLDLSLKAKGMKLKATVHAGAGDVTCHLDVPLIAMMYRAKAEAAIRSELTTLLA